MGCWPTLEVIMSQIPTATMLEGEIISREWECHGTTWTNNEQFDRDGYIVIENIWDPKELYSELGTARGQYKWWGNELDQYILAESVESQVQGSYSRYWHPQYRRVHDGLRKKLEKVIGRKLYNTYYYDRFYMAGQELFRHIDRDSCEISVSVHISSNIKEDWPFWIKTPDVYRDKSKKELLVPGENRSVILEPGDGIIYKGCERPHWRDRMPGTLQMALGMTHHNDYTQLYYHQIFFHYVLQDGIRAHFAWDNLS